jgi:hypothetical protein
MSIPISSLKNSLQNSPWGIIGGAIILVACVTDEARKLREEQDLTV